MEEFGHLTSLVCAQNGGIVEKCDVERGKDHQKLVVKYNICYIVAGIVINDKDEVLMVQEAKPSCRGKWYLPAGRMEPNESIIDGVKREVLEEAGLEFEPITILCVEEGGGCWVRIAFLGKAVGGKLKTLNEADEESLQAMWWNRQDDIPLRCTDILPLIKLGEEWKNRLSTRQPALLPIIQPQSSLFLRILTVHCDETEDYSLLLHKGSQNGKYYIPTSRINLADRSFHNAVEHLYDEVFSQTARGDHHLNLKILGILAVEHSGNSVDEKDGLGVTILVRITTDHKPACAEPYCWMSKEQIPNKQLITLLDRKVNSSTLTPLRSLKGVL